VSLSSFNESLIVVAYNFDQFEEVHASMDGRRLKLTYPNMRPIRVEPRRVDSS
jgi:hypothetical protein